MANFSKDALTLLELVGGKENIQAASHCVTRMRFVLIDEQKAILNKEKIEALESVKGVFQNAGQFQVIIGNQIGEFYNIFAQISGIDGVSKEQVKSIAKTKQNFLQALVAHLAEIFTPILPAIIVGGLILGFRNILEGVDFGGSTIVEQSAFWNGINAFLWLPGEAIFHFLPVGIVWSVVRKFGGTQILGIVLGICLVSPQLLNAYGVNTARELGNIPFWDFGIFTIEKIGYQAQILPAIFAGLLFVYLEKQLRKIIPESIQMVVVPFFSLIPAIIVAHTIIGPIGWSIGQGLSSIVNAGLTSSFHWLFAFLFGLLYAPLVITGLHHTTLAIDSQLIADLGYTNLWPMICLSNIAQGAAVLGIIFLHRNKKEEQISVPATISAWLGVTEPAMFGINLKFMYGFIAAMIGSAIAGTFATIMQVKANAIGVGGLPGILAIQGGSWINFIISILIAIIVPFILVFIISKMKRFNK